MADLIQFLFKSGSRADAGSLFPSSMSADARLAWEIVIKGRVMANIVSIDWQVEDFRRLISDQSQLSEAELPIAKAVDIVSVEIAPSSEIRGASPVLSWVEVVLPEEVDFPDLEVVDETAIAEPGETPTLEVSGYQATFETALEIVNFEVIEPRKPGNQDEITNSSEVAVATPALGVDQRINSEEHLEADVPETTEQPAAPRALEAPSELAMGPAVPPVFAAVRKVTPKSSTLQKAVVAPDINANRTTHDTTNTLYRGVEYSMVKGAIGGVWRWSVRVGQPEMLRMGEASTAEQAELNVRSVIDRAIAVTETLRHLKRNVRADEGA